MGFDWLSSLDLVWASLLVIAGYAVLLAFALTRPAEDFYEGAPDRARWRDLRWWIVPLIAIQIGLYWLLR